MTHVSYEDPSSLRTRLACTIVVLLLLRRKNKQRSNPLRLFSQIGKLGIFGTIRHHFARMITYHIPIG